MERPASFFEDILKLRLWGEYGYSVPESCEAPTARR